MTRMTCRIRMNRMTINEMTWMAGISRMSGMTRTTGMTRMNNCDNTPVITGVTGTIVMKRKSRKTSVTRMNGMMR